MISARSKEEILSASRVEEVIGEFVNLKKRGTNYIGLCPFHIEKTPSFNVSPTKGIFKCFGCGKAGDVITFLIEHEKFNYPEALRWLAQKYHVALEETGDKVKEQDDRMLMDSLYIINQHAHEYFHSNLYNTEEGETVGLAYFKERGLTAEMIQKFKLGYALQQDNAFTITAQKTGYQLELLKKAGLVVNRGYSDADFFHQRVIFPILNLSGKVVAFAGRVMVKDEKAPKYINSPETEIYQKSKLVYGIFQARNAIRQTDECFLTEGYTDVISMHQAGIENVVASSGTSLTEDQIKLIKRFTDNITILYDGDEAGIKAALRGLELMASQDVNIRVVLLPDGDDPDSFLHRKGSAALREFIRDNKKHFLQFKTEVLMKDAGTDPLKRADVIKEVVGTLALVPDVVRRSILLKEVSRMLDVKEQVLITEVNKQRREKFRKNAGSDKFEADALYSSASSLPDHREQLYADQSDALQERDIVRLLLEFGRNPMQEGLSVAEYVLNEVRDVNVNQLHCRLMIHEIEAQIEAGSIPDHHYFLHHADEELRRLALEIISSPYVLSENWNKMHDIYIRMPAENFVSDVKSSISRFKMKKIVSMMADNLKELREAKGNAEEEDYFMNLHQRLNQWKQQLGGEIGTVVVN